MRTLELLIAYDGTRFAGWQAQDARPTIQGTLERALSTVLRERIQVIGSGRTDAGVHALGQVAHVRVRRSHPAIPRLLRSVNALLPPDLAILRIEPAPAAFHARFNTVRKRYRYRLFLGPVVPPFIRPYVHHVTMPLRLDRMRQELTELKGRHDFRAFVRAGSVRGSTVRRLSRVTLRRVGEEVQIELEGTGFLHTMVRSIVGTLLDVGRGRLPPGTVRYLLRTRGRHLAGTTAPAHGLTLVSVHY